MEYLESLSERTRQKTKDQFVKIKAKGDMMVFVKDAINQKLRSYVYPK